MIGGMRFGWFPGTTLTQACTAPPDVANIPTQSPIVSVQDSAKNAHISTQAQPCHTSPSGSKTTEVYGRGVNSREFLKNYGHNEHTSMRLQSMIHYLDSIKLKGSRLLVLADARRQRLKFRHSLSHPHELLSMVANQCLL